jgi:large subunit ribosomal protein L9
MEIILREDVPNVGHTGDVVKVKPGFARNYLLPRGLAVVADRGKVRELEHQKRILADKRERERQASQSLATSLAAVKLLVKARAGAEGKLFGSVTNIDVERALVERGFTVDRRRIKLEEPIKSLGDHRVVVRLAAGVDTAVTVSVEADGDLAQNSTAAEAGVSGSEDQAETSSAN